MSAINVNMAKRKQLMKETINAFIIILKLLINVIRNDVAAESNDICNTMWRLSSWLSGRRRDGSKNATAIR